MLGKGTRSNRDPNRRLYRPSVINVDTVGWWAHKKQLSLFSMISSIPYDNQKRSDIATRSAMTSWKQVHDEYCISNSMITTQAVDGFAGMSHMDDQETNEDRSTKEPFQHSSLYNIKVREDYTVDQRTKRHTRSISSERTYSDTKFSFLRVSAIWNVRSASTLAILLPATLSVQAARDAWWCCFQPRQWGGYCVLATPWQSLPCPQTQGIRKVHHAEILQTNTVQVSNQASNPAGGGSGERMTERIADACFLPEDRFRGNCISTVFTVSARKVI